MKRGSGGRTVNKVKLEDYVRSVVPSEMPTSWAPDAVRAQAVAARSYAIRIRDFTSYSGYDICDTTACQVYGGMATTSSGGTRTVRETAAGTAAAKATAGTIVTYGGQVALTQFASSNGGAMSSGGYSYLREKDDPYDGVVRSQAWSRTITAKAVAQAYPSVGTVKQLTITKRDGSGRYGRPGAEHQDRRQQEHEDRDRARPSRASSGCGRRSTRSPPDDHDHRRMIDGFEVGHHTADGDGWLTGTTVVLARDGAVGGVDVRGGGPGTRETDLLDPSTLVERVHAVVLTGGSAYGLAAADGVMAGLEDLGIGLPVGPGPGARRADRARGAVIFDLGRGGAFRNRPDAAFGRAALDAAASADDPRPRLRRRGDRREVRRPEGRGGLGRAATLPTGVRVAALVVVQRRRFGGRPARPVGCGRTARGRLRDPDRRRAGRARARRGASRAPSLNTTIGVVLTDATLTKAQARKVAAVAHDGLARAVAPVHSMSDGDTVFCLASGRRPLTDEPAVGWAGTRRRAFNALLEAAADVFTAACLDALLQAEGRGPWRSYAELAPSAVGREIPAGG